MLQLLYMQEAIQPTAKRGRPPKSAFSLPADDRLTEDHMLIDVGHEHGTLFFVFGRNVGDDEVSISYKPSKTEFAALMDAVKTSSLSVGSLAFPLRGAVREAFHAAVLTAHYRSL